MKKPKSTAVFNTDDFPMSLVRMGVLRATGIDTDEAAGKPIIAIACSETDINPGHMHLGGLAQRVREGILAAGGVPFVFNVPAPCDGLTEGHEGMRYVLAQRDLIADIIETHVRSMRYDGLVCVASCDKIVPGMLMSAARLDMPTIFVTGGHNSMEIRLSAHMKDSINHSAYDDLEAKMAAGSCATCGACEIMGTANTMQCLTEALGLSLTGSAAVPAFAAEKSRLARLAGKRIVELVEEEVTARALLDRASLENALMVSQAIGGSTNAALHLPALAHELGLELSLAEFNDYSVRIPTLCGIAPNGPWGMIDLFKAGGVPAILSRLAGKLNADCATVDGTTIGELAAGASVLDDKVVRPIDDPFYAQGGTVALFGNLAPEGSVIKQSAVRPDMHVFSGPARVFDSERACLDALRESTIKDGEVVIIRYEGPKGGPGMPETLAVTLGIMFAGFERVALVTDGRFSGATSGPCIGHVSPEAQDGGPLAIVRDGDIISLDIPARKIGLELSDEEIAARLEAWTPPPQDIPDGYMRRYVKLVSSAAKGAVQQA